jgi:hypothetical protein
MNMAMLDDDSGVRLPLTRRASAIQDHQLFGAASRLSQFALTYRLYLFVSVVCLDLAILVIACLRSSPT